MTYRAALMLAGGDEEMRICNHNPQVYDQAPVAEYTSKRYARRLPFADFPQATRCADLFDALQHIKASSYPCANLTNADREHATHTGTPATRKPANVTLKLLHLALYPASDSKGVTALIHPQNLRPSLSYVNLLFSVLRTFLSSEMYAAAA